MQENSSLFDYKRDDLKSSITDLSNFSPSRVLSADIGRKKICVEGTFIDRDEKAVLVLEQNGLCEENVKELFTDVPVFKNTFVNDIYRNYECLSKKKSLNGIKTILIHPATEEDIKKYQSYPGYIINETPELYCDVSLPHIECYALNLQWVYDILQYKAEQERIVYEDKNNDVGFVLLPHLKWDLKEIEELHLIAIVRQHGIKSLRDLKLQHLPLLKNIREQGTKFIEEKYGLCSSHLLIFVHYLPSYYHLHIHFSHIRCMEAGKNTEEAHLLSEIIENIELVADYYKKAVIPVVIKESDDLFSLYRDKGLINEIKKSEDTKHPV